MPNWYTEHFSRQPSRPGAAGRVLYYKMMAIVTVLGFSARCSDSISFETAKHAVLWRILSELIIETIDVSPVCHAGGRGLEPRHSRHFL